MPNIGKYGYIPEAYMPLERQRELEWEKKHRKQVMTADEVHQRVQEKRRAYARKMRLRELGVKE